MSLRERVYCFRSFWIFPTLAVLLIYQALKVDPQQHIRNLAWPFLTGLLAWTLIEYGLHRFVFHIRLPVRNPWMRTLLSASHLEHHAAPRDRSKVLVQSVYGLTVSAMVFGILYLVTRSLFTSTGVIAGIWTGFLYYEAVHYRVHFSLSGNGLIARQRKAHFHHHFTNNKQNFGVTSPLWDLVFGTARGR
jgi:sterol desaturase/sphingolipid hydroxylase (fatty acid hydroxylase superfamily)